MADLRDKVRPGIALETPLDERGLFAPVPADRSPGALAPQQDQPLATSSPASRPFARRLQLLPALPSLATEQLSADLRLALATEWERGTAFLFAPVLLAAGALSYFAVPREPYFLTVRRIGDRRGSADLPGAVAADPASGIRSAAMFWPRHVLCQAGDLAGRHQDARRRNLDQAHRPRRASSSIRPMAASG